MRKYIGQVHLHTLPPFWSQDALHASREAPFNPDLDPSHPPTDTERKLARQHHLRSRLFPLRHRSPTLSIPEELRFPAYPSRDRKSPLFAWRRPLHVPTKRHAITKNTGLSPYLQFLRSPEIHIAVGACSAHLTHGFEGCGGRCVVRSS